MRLFKYSTCIYAVYMCVSVLARSLPAPTPESSVDWGHGGLKGGHFREKHFGPGGPCSPQGRRALTPAPLAYSIDCRTLIVKLLSAGTRTVKA